jgi:pimeloyl-ACP methyl ester carboxylesterase
MKKYSIGLMLIMLMSFTNSAIGQLRRIGTDVKSNDRVSVFTHDGPATPVDDVVNAGPGNGGFNPTAGNRNVVWVHGWEGGRNSWGVYSRKYGRDVGTDGVVRDGERKMNCFRVDYATKPNRYAQTVIQAVGHVKQELAEANIAPSNQNIFIGHSLGGLTTRKIDQMDNGTNLYGGFITVGTPNKGALIAKAVMEGKGDDFVNNALFALVSPFYDAWWAQALLGLGVINSQIDIIKRIFPSVGPAEDLSTTSPLVGSLNSFNHGDKKIITMSARESGQKLWRELSSLAINAPSGLQLHQVGDNVMGNTMANIEGMYNGAGVVSAAYAIVSACYGNFWTAAKWGVRSVLFFYGASWIKNAPTVWNNLVGANRTELRPVYGPALKPEFHAAWNAWRADQGCITRGAPGCSLTAYLATLTQAERDNAYHEAVLYNISVPFVNEDNDGIILKSSANGIAEGPNVLNLEMELVPTLGVNHQECMNHEYVTNKFEYIFNGLTDRQDKSSNFKDFFTIPPR